MGPEMLPEPLKQLGLVGAVVYGCYMLVRYFQVKLDQKDDYIKELVQRVFTASEQQTRATVEQTNTLRELTDAIREQREVR